MVLGLHARLFLLIYYRQLDACSQIWMPAILSSASGVRNAPAGNAAAATNLNTAMISSWINILFVLLIGGVLISGGLGFPTQFRGLDHR